MEYRLPLCPNCGTELGAYEKVWYSNDGDYYCETWKGQCPDCDKWYEWDEIYSFERIDNVEEIGDP